MKLTMSLPSRGRGLKQYRSHRRLCVIKSLPSRGRGLKPQSSHGHDGRPHVASFTGAWIGNILDRAVSAIKRESLPSRGRGLKQNTIDLRPCVGLSLPSRGRGLKP